MASTALSVLDMGLSKGSPVKNPRTTVCNFDICGHLIEDFSLNS